MDSDLYFIGIIDDDVILRESIKNSLKTTEKYKVHITTGNPEEVCKFVGLIDINFIFVNEHLQWGTGLEALRKIKKAFPACHCIFMTGDNDSRVLPDAFKFGAKGVSLQDL